MSAKFGLQTAAMLTLTCRGWAEVINESELVGCAYADFYEVSPELVCGFEKTSGRNFYDAIEHGGIRMGRLLRMMTEDRYDSFDGIFRLPMESAVCAALIGTVVRCAGSRRGLIAVTEAATLCSAFIAFLAASPTPSL